eukprot:7228064-Karenia_brevis.AAC.1
MPLHNQMCSSRALDKMRDVISFNAAISAGDRGLMCDVISFKPDSSPFELHGQWQRAMPLHDEMCGSR